MQTSSPLAPEVSFGVIGGYGVIGSKDSPAESEDLIDGLVFLNTGETSGGRGLFGFQHLEDDIFIGQFVK